MKKRCIILLCMICLGIFSSCTDFIAKEMAQTAWDVYSSDSIILHVRPENYSIGAAPTSEEAQEILSNQEVYYDQIVSQLGNPVFSDPILIYVYNKEEALELIGTQGGGHAVPKFNTVYYTYLPYGEEQTFTDRYGRVNPLVGAHETAHVISHRVLGYPKTKLMSEGYANYLDGSYGRRDIHDLYDAFSAEERLSPTQMLNYESIRESLYYPNCGVFIEYLVQEYGIAVVNALFTLSKEEIPSHFYAKTGITWNEMEEAYLGR